MARRKPTRKGPLKPGLPGSAAFVLSLERTARPELEAESLAGLPILPGYPADEVCGA